MTCTELDQAQAPPRLASDFAASTNSNHRTGDGSLYLAAGDLSFRRQNVFAGESFQSWKIMGIYCKIEKDNSCSLMKRFQKEPPCFSKVSRNPMGGDPCANHFGRMCDGQKTMEKKHVDTSHLQSISGGIGWVCLKIGYLQFHWITVIIPLI